MAEEQVILSPGVGFQGGDAGKALAAGADYLIVGRSIIGSKDPVKTVEGAEPRSWRSRLLARWFALEMQFIITSRLGQQESDCRRYAPGSSE